MERMKKILKKLTYVSYLLSAYAFIITITGTTGVVRLIRLGIDKLKKRRQETW